MYGGIVFMQTRQLDLIREFYIRELGFELWLEQAECVILKHGNLLLGFCQRDGVDADAMITMVYETTAEVDAMYERHRAIAECEPRQNDKYRIYQFFARDPENRHLEFQYFMDPMEAI